MTRSIVDLGKVVAVQGQIAAIHGGHILPIRNADLAAGVPYLVTELPSHGTIGLNVELMSI